jgi:Lon protease-like protein
MARHCLEGHRHMGIALLKHLSGPADDGTIPEEAPGESFESTVGVGRIVQHERLPDGRYILLLEGRGRAHIQEEIPPDANRLFRLARTRAVVDDVDLSEKELSEQVLKIKGAYLNMSGMPPDDPLAQFLVKEQDPSRIADVVAARLLEEPAARQKVLCESRLGPRLELALEAVATAILESLGA